ncbi:MAG: hypothetical protein ABIR70_13765 [Bryobacteraceae bacterium]
MTIQLAALVAAIGVLLRALHYWVANMIPSWNSSGVMEQVSLALVSVVDPVIWTYYFVTIWRNLPSRLAAALAALLGLAEIGYTGYRQYETLSWVSLDTLLLLFGALIPVLCWAVYLLTGKKFVLWYLLLFNLLQVALSVYQIATSYSVMQEFWKQEPWQLLVAPLIWLIYWASQTLFVHAAQKA